MANSRYTQFFYTKRGKPTLLDLDIPIGATGAVGTIVGPGIKSVVRITTGTYQINFNDNYNKFLGLAFDLWSPNSGSDVNDGSFVSGTVYVITTVGTTDWHGAGLGTGITAAVGVAFKATGTGGSGSGKGQVQSVSAISDVEVIGKPGLTINPTGVGATNGYIIIQTLAATNSSTTTLVATDPASGSTLGLEIYFSDSANVANDFG